MRKWRKACDCTQMQCCVQSRGTHKKESEQIFMNAAEIRARAFSKQLKLAQIANLKDFFPELVDENGNPLVQLREITGAESQVVLADAKSMAPKLLAFSIITIDTKEQVFTVTDISTIMETLGMTAIVPLTSQAMELSGLSDNASASAKNA